MVYGINLGIHTCMGVYVHCNKTIVFMYTCMCKLCLYIKFCVYAHAHVYISRTKVCIVCSLFIHACMQMSMNSRMQIIEIYQNLYAHTRWYICVCFCMYVSCVFPRTHTCTYTCTYIRTCIYYVYTRIFTYVPTDSCHIQHI